MPLGFEYLETHAIRTQLSAKLANLYVTLCTSEGRWNGDWRWECDHSELKQRRQEQDYVLHHDLHRYSNA